MTHIIGARISKAALFINRKDPYRRSRPIAAEPDRKTHTSAATKLNVDDTCVAMTAAVM